MLRDGVTGQLSNTLCDHVDGRRGVLVFWVPSEVWPRSARARLASARGRPLRSPSTTDKATKYARVSSCSLGPALLSVAPDSVDALPGEFVPRSVMSTGASDVRKGR